MVSVHELEATFERGRRLGRRENLPFEGIPRLLPWTHGADFRFERSWFDSFVNYEREVRDDLRRVQQARWSQGRDRQALVEELREAEARARRGPAEVQHLPWPHRWLLLLSRPWLDSLETACAEVAAHDRRSAALEQLQRRTEAELSVARKAVDAELDEGRGRPCVVDAMRLDPNRPLGVREFADVEAFVGEDWRRALGDWPRRKDASGADYGYDWRMEDPSRRWNTTRWRVSWLCVDDPTYELYAVEFADESEGHASPGRVWLLGVLREQPAVVEALGELERHAQHERNSLVAVAEAVQTAASRLRDRSSSE